METKTFSEARATLAKTWDQVIATRQPVALTRVGSEPVVLLPRAEFEAMARRIAADDAIERDLAAIRATAGSARGVFGPGFLAELREEWPA